MRRDQARARLVLQVGQKQAAFRRVDRADQSLQDSLGFAESAHLRPIDGLTPADATLLNPRSLREGYRASCRPQHRDRTNRAGLVGAACSADRLPHGPAA